MRWIPFLGMLVMLGIAWALSTNRRAVDWRLVGTGTALQFALGLLILRTEAGQAAFAAATDAVTAFLDFSDAGASFIFGGGPDDDPFTEHFFAFKVLPTIIFFSSFITILYHLGWIQWLVKGFARVMVWVMRTSGGESLSAAGNIFVGQTEAPLLIRPYVGTMTLSELMAVMTGGFATIAGGVLAAYVGMGVPAGHLIAASVMSAPAALVMAKLMFPETEESLTRGTVKIDPERPWVNVIDAATEGAGAGLKLALNVGAMLLAFIALIAMLNAGIGALGASLGVEGLTLQAILGWILRPLAFLMGVEWAEADEIGALLGIKTILNEFVGYAELERMAAAGLISERSEIIATYALCGFANFSSIAIQIGGIGAIAPERKQDLARLGLRAMVAGSLACFQTATIAGMLL